MGPHEFRLTELANSWRSRLVIYPISLRSDLSITHIAVERPFTNYLSDIGVHFIDKVSTDLSFCGFLCEMLFSEVVRLNARNVVEL